MSDGRASRHSTRSACREWAVPNVGTGRTATPPSRLMSESIFILLDLLPDGPALKLSSAMQEARALLVGFYFLEVKYARA